MIRSPAIVVVTRQTRLKGLAARWGTASAAKFRLKMAHEHRAPKVAQTAAANFRVAEDADFEDYENEDQVYQSSLDQLREELDLGQPLTFIDRAYLPTFDFRGCPVVVVVGQDGLVANVAKYVGDTPIVAINPDPSRFDGQLLPFRLPEARNIVRQTLTGAVRYSNVTLAEVALNDGQRMLAFNDFFVGCSGHTSARYTLTFNGQVESQSSSGLIVSTGAGSTGWLSSMFNMVEGFANWLGATHRERPHMEWSDPRLAWVVREPFRSRRTGANLVAGLLDEGQELVIESLMPERGIIFSDGIEADFLEFQSGTIARISRSPQQARLVIKT